MARPRNGRGGSRTPSNPAPVSGPGALSRRTDGGPGQPVREIPASEHGERQALVAQQQAAPLAAGGQQPAVAPRSAFAPTDRPGEPPTAGASFGPGRTPLHTADADYFTILAAAHRQTDDPYLLKLMRRVRSG